MLCCTIAPGPSLSPKEARVKARKGGSKEGWKQGRLEARKAGALPTNKATDLIADKEQSRVDQPVLEPRDLLLWLAGAADEIDGSIGGVGEAHHEASYAGHEARHRQEDEAADDPAPPAEFLPTIESEHNMCGTVTVTITYTVSVAETRVKERKKGRGDGGKEPKAGDKHPMPG